MKNFRNMSPEQAGKLYRLLQKIDENKRWKNKYKHKDQLTIKG